MSSFIPNTPTTATGTMTNDGYFPNIDIADFAKAARISDTVTPEQQKNALQQAIITINEFLSRWDKSDPFVSDQDPKIGESSRKLLLYHDAVYSWAKMRILEDMRDYDYTNQGETTDLQSMIDDQAQRAQEAVRRLLAKPTKTIELI